MHELTAAQRRAILNWERAEAARAAVAETLAAARVARTSARQVPLSDVRLPDDPDDYTPPMRTRTRVEAVHLMDGLRQVGTVRVQGRELPEEWLADPIRAATAMANCSVNYGIGWNATLSRWVEFPLGCGQAICPLCARRRAANRARRWAPVLQYLSVQGCPVLHLTATQPVNSPTELRRLQQELGAEGGAAEYHRRHPGWMRRAVVLTPQERASGLYDRLDISHALDTGEGYSVPGEPLAAAVERLMEAFTLLRDGAASRAWWCSTVLGAIVGYEVTGMRRGEDGAPTALRWHAHFHMILVLRDSMAGQLRTRTETTPAGRRRQVLCPDSPWYSQWLRRWHAVSGGRPGGQDAELLQAGPTFADAVQEALKYPAKVAEMTTAQTAEWLAATKGLRLSGMRYGGLHGTSRLGTVARWLAAEGREGFGARMRALDLSDELGQDIPHLSADHLTALRLFDSGKGDAALAAWGRMSPPDRRQASKLAVALLRVPTPDRVLAAWREHVLGEILHPLAERHPTRPGVFIRPLYREDLRRAVWPQLGDRFVLGEVYLCTPDGLRVLPSFNAAECLKATEEPPLSADEREILTQILIQRAIPDTVGFAQQLPGELLLDSGRAHVEARRYSRPDLLGGEDDEDATDPISF